MLKLFAMMGGKRVVEIFGNRVKFRFKVEFAKTKFYHLWYPKDNLLGDRNEISNNIEIS